MDILEAVLARKSIRGYKPDPVPKEVILEILKTSTRSPSAMNTQPWEFLVVAGDVLDNIRRGNIEKLLSGSAPSPDYPSEGYQGVFKQRQVELAIEIFKLMGIAREDSAKRLEWMQRGFRFFDAPAAIIIAADRSVEGTMSMFDLGAVAQTICLLALARGLGTCIEGQGVMFPQVIRKYTGLPESKSIKMSIAIGYPDWEFPANSLESKREALESMAAWHGFDS
ncbi:MAG: nitroreductase [Desulfocucumaceae bacterium]